MIDRNDPIDWFQTPIMSFGCSHEFDCAMDKGENGLSFDIDLDNIGRDGCFADEQLYAVFEKSDLEKLQEKISKNKC